MFYHNLEEKRAKKWDNLAVLPRSGLVQRFRQRAPGCLSPGALGVLVVVFDQASPARRLRFHILLLCFTYNSFTCLQNR